MGFLTRAAARKAWKASEAGVASDSAGVAPEAMATMTCVDASEYAVRQL